MKIGLFSDGLPDLSFTEFLDWSVQQGIGAVEIGTGGFSSATHCDLDGLLADEGARQEFIEAIESRGLKLSALNINSNPLDPDAARGKRDSEALFKTIELAGRIGLGTVVTMSGCPGDPSGGAYPNWVTHPWQLEFHDLYEWQWQEVVTPFWKKARAEMSVDAPLDRPRLGETSAPEAWPDSDDLDAFELTPEAQDGVDWGTGMAEEWTPGEGGALDRLDAFLDDALLGYPDGRNVPAIRGSSMLSPHLHWGEISPRTVWDRVQSWVSNGATREDADVFLSEIGWREFSYHVLHHFPDTPTEPLKDKYAAMPWRATPSYLEAWQRGQTGYPLVDAGMRQLWSIGWMHNRVRMVTASFLTKDLLVPWQEGAQWFWDTLCGGDLANNTMGWQWAAGCGADAQPFFRIFNPVSQSQKHDPDGTYIRRWVPELADLPTKHLHAPWEAPDKVLAEAGVVLGETYPAPMVDHSERRDIALEALKEVNG